MRLFCVAPDLSLPLQIRSKRHELQRSPIMIVAYMQYPLHRRGHLNKGQLDKIEKFTKQFMRDISLEVSSLHGDP